MIEMDRLAIDISALHAFLDAAPDPTLVVRSDGTILHANRLLRALFGYGEAELAGQGIELLVPEGLRARHASHRQGYAVAPSKRSMGQGGEIFARHRDGSPIPVEITLGPVQLGGEPVVCCAVRDLRARKRAEAALRESEERFRALTELTSDFYWEQDAQLRFVERVGLSWEKRSYPADITIGRTRWELPALNLTEADWARHRADLEAHREFRNLEIERPLPGGGSRWISTSGRPIFDGEGRFRGYRGVGQDITERKLAEQNMRQSDAQVRLIADSVPAMISYLDRDARFVYVNRHYAAFFGAEVRDLVGQSAAERLGEVAWGQVRPYFEQALAEQPAAFEGRYRRFDGSIRDLLVELVPHRDASGRVAGVFGLAQDVSKRRRAERSLREREAQLNLVVDNVPAMICYFDAEYRYRYANRSYVQFYAGGRSLDGKTLREGLGDPVWEVARPSIDRALAGESVTYSRIDQRNGGERQVEITMIPHRDAGGRVLGVHTMVLDVTERRRAEEALRLRNRAIESSMNSVMITEPGAQGQRIVYVNPAFERITGYAEAEVLGQSPRLLYRDDREQPAVEVLRKAFREQREATALLRNYRKDGSLFWNEVRVAPVPDEAGRVTHFINIANDVTERVRYEKEIERNANYDALTGLPNRNLLNDRLAHAVVQAERGPETLAVMFLDLDHLKRINDTLGHHVGDKVIAAAGTRIAVTLRSGDTVARLGGDEFVILLPNLKRADNAERVAAKVLGAIAAPLRVGPNEFVLSASIGIAVHPKDGAEGETLLRNADSALFRAKEEGRNGFRFFAPEMNDRVVRFLSVERELRTALDARQFWLQYQPIVDLRTGQTVGVEALMRWRRTDGALVSPAEFIPIAEESGLILPIGRWVFESAARQAAAWNRGRRTPLYVSVNLSARQFHDPGLLDSIREAIRGADVAPSLIKFEITESTVMHDPENAVVLLQALKDIGVDLSVDDFGTGYSSLAYLKRFPIDILKLDRSFVGELPGNADDLAISCAVIDLARALDLTVVAEGIETQEQADILAAKGCRFAQGFFFGRPVDPSHIAQAGPLRRPRVA